MGTSFAFNEERMLMGIQKYRDEQKAAIPREPLTPYEMLPLHMRKIVRCVAQYFSVEVGDVISTCRKQNLVIARWVVTYLGRKHNHSYPQIGRFLGHHHSTVMHSHRQAIEQYAHSAAFREAVDEISKRAA